MLKVLFGHDANHRGNSHIPMALCERWTAQGWPVELTVPSAPRGRRPAYLRTALDGLQKWAVYRCFPAKSRELAEASFLDRVTQDDLAYLWAGLSTEVFEKLAEREIPRVVERINCRQATARALIDPAYAHWGVRPDHRIDESRIEAERRKLDMVDAVFSPSPEVRDSLISQGVPRSKILDTSYGWALERFPQRRGRPRDSRTPRFLFVGRVGVRKGIPMLLEAWKRASLPAELVICGQLEPAMKGPLASRLELPGVRYIPFTNDIGRIYNETDVFVFPTLEEGGPLVTYEAMAHGLLPIVSPMGAGAIVRNGLDGVVRDPWDLDGWVQCLSRAYRDTRWRLDLADAAIGRADHFTWDKVARRRMRRLLEKFPEQLAQRKHAESMAAGY